MSAILQGYLAAWLFWAGLSVGCLAVLMLHHLVGGRWGFLVQRRLEAGAAAIPLAGLLFLPVALGLARVFPWAAPGAAVDPELAHKSAYLNAPFFLARAAFYLLVWWALGAALRRASLEQESGAVRTRRLTRLAAGGLAAVVLTATFAALDWMMSLEPKWHSSLYGLDVLVGHSLAALAFVVAAAALGSPRPAQLTPERLHDLGNMLLAFVMLWAYLAFSQWLLIWSADLPAEAPWYLRRSSGGWGAVVVLLALFHFAFPFLALLSRDVKRSSRALAAAAAVVLAARVLDLAWRVVPALEPGALAAAAPAWAALGAAWTAVYLRALRSAPSFPRDPRMREAHG